MESAMDKPGESIKLIITKAQLKTRAIIKNNFAVCDTRFILDYYRFTEDWRLLFGAGETYTSTFIHNSEDFVRKRMVKVFPMLSDAKIDFSWGGTLAITSNTVSYTHLTLPTIYSV